MRFQGRIMGVVIVSTAVVTGAGSTVLISQSGGASGQSASALLTRAIKDAEASGWVHEVVTHSNSGVLQVTMVDDIGTYEGRQVVTSQDGGTTALIALDQDHKMFIRGNDAGLVGWFGFTTSSALKYAEKWIELTPSDTTTYSSYSAVAASTTLASDFGPPSFALTGTLKLGAVTTLRGQRVRAISGTYPYLNGAPNAKVVLYVTTSGRLLPAEFRVTSGAASASDIWTKVWTNWGEKVNVNAPAGAVPMPKS